MSNNDGHEPCASPGSLIRATKMIAAQQDLQEASERLQTAQQKYARLAYVSILAASESGDRKRSPSELDALKKVKEAARQLEASQAAIARLEGQKQPPHS
jgi:hypothetical protein